MRSSEFQSIYNGENSDYVSVTNEVIIDSNTWRTFYTKVWKHLPTEEFLKFSWSKGNGGNYNGFEDITAVKVKQVQKIVYEAAE